MKGKFITVEGFDGSGKTTNIHYLKALFEHAGYEVMMTREPGGAPLSEKIRQLILSEKMHPMTELLLFAAARAEHINALIKPAIAQGMIVLCDRFTDSTYAYQGAGRGYVDDVLTLQDLATDGFEPDVTLFFDVELDESIRRLKSRKQEGGEINRLDDEELAFKQRTADGYKLRYMQNKHRMHRIDANQPLEHVQDQLRNWFEKIYHKPGDKHLSLRRPTQRGYQ